MTLLTVITVTQLSFTRILFNIISIFSSIVFNLLKKWKVNVGYNGEQQFIPFINLYKQEILKTLY